MRREKNKYVFASDKGRFKRTHRIRNTILILIPLLVLTFFISNIAVSRRVRLEEVRLTILNLPVDLEEYSILHISDLHGARLGEKQRPDVTVLTQHIPGHDHTGIPGAPQCRLDRLLLFSQPCAVQIADMQDRIFLQVRRQVQDRQPDFLQPYPPGNRKIGNHKGQHQERNQDQDRTQNPVGPLEPAPVRRENIFVFLPPHRIPPPIFCITHCTTFHLENKAFRGPVSETSGAFPPPSEKKYVVYT